jgi:uncharacterized protein
MIRIVLDTNLFVSAFLTPDGKPAKILALSVQGELGLLMSPAILKEIALVLDYPKIVRLLKKRGMGRNYVQEKLQQIIKTAAVVPGSVAVNHIQQDPSDNVILACAVEGFADYVVSGDHHLTDLKSFHGIPIVTPDTFLALLGRL